MWFKLFLYCSAFLYAAVIERGSKCFCIVLFVCIQQISNIVQTVLHNELIMTTNQSVRCLCSFVSELSWQ